MKYIHILGQLKVEDVKFALLMAPILSDFVNSPLGRDVSTISQKARPGQGYGHYIDLIQYDIDFAGIVP